MAPQESNCSPESDEIVRVVVVGMSDNQSGDVEASAAGTATHAKGLRTRFGNWDRDDLHAGELREYLKVRVTGKQDKRMLQDEGCDPHIIRRNGGALLTQLPVNGSVMMRGLLVGIEHTDAGLQEKTSQDSFVPWSLAARSETSAQFS